MELPKQARITRCSTNTIELAAIQTLNREDAKNLIDAVWWKDVGNTTSNPKDEPDRKWKWRELISAYQNKPYFRAVCLKTADQAIQAAILYRVDALSALELGQKAVFVDRLAVAPRNRDNLAEAPVFRGGGSGLIAYAAAVSYSLGFSGRINLFAVANEEFYEHRGFVDTGTIVENEILLELPTSSAVTMLQERGLI